MAGTFRVRVDGLQGLRSALGAFAEQKLPEALGQELYRDMVGVMLESQDQVPYDEGDLHDSGEVDRPRFSGSSVEVVLHYGSASVPYALVQHENLDYKHPRGGKAKFLEDPLNAWGEDGAKEVAQRAIRRAAGR